MVLEEDCVASESVSGGWAVEDSVLETRSGPEVSLLQAEKLKRLSLIHISEPTRP